MDPTMNDTTPVPTAETSNQFSTRGEHTDPLEEFARELGRELGETAGEQIGTALAEQIHEDPQTRQAAAAGVGVGVGVVVGVGLLALFAQ